MQAQEVLPTSSAVPVSGGKQTLSSAYHTSSTLNQTLSKRTELTVVGMTLKVMREEGGVPGLYRGLITTAVGVAPYVGINFAAYEALRGVVTPPGKNSVVRKLACGALAGTMTQVYCLGENHNPFYYRINITNSNIPIRCAETKDASHWDGQWRIGISLQRCV